MIEERHQDFLRFGRPIPPSGEFWFGKNCTLSQNIYLPHLLISIKHQHETIDKKEQGTRFLLLTDSFHSIQMKNPRPHPSNHHTVVLDGARSSREESFYHRVSWYYNIERNKQCCSTAHHFRSSAVSSIIKNTRPQWGKLFVSKAPPYRLVSSLLFQVFPKKTVAAPCHGDKASRILLPRWKGSTRVYPFAAPKITPSLVCKKCDVLMEENEEPCKGQVSAVSDTGPAGPAMSNAMLKKE